MPTKLPERIDLSQAEAKFSVVPDSRRTRPLFFDGKFLTAADLNREQSYLLTRQADLARSLGFGVVDGLRVERSDKTASDVSAAAASLRITAGHGLTPAGEAVLLPKDKIVDLSDVPRLENLNASFGLAQKPQQPFYNLSGLFVVGLRAVEFTANPTPVFPPSLQGTQSLQDGEIIEATAITLVPYESAAGFSDPARARTRAAREIFLEQKPPKLPAGVLPLAMIFLRGGFLQWVDEFLVRREAGDDDRFGFGFAPRALAEAHFFHYRDLLDEVPAPPKDGRLGAADFFEILPPGGPLPAGTVDLKDFTQAFFPPEARVELTLVPEDELAGLMEESLDQPPLDLRLKPEDNDALAILLLAPVPRAGYRDALQQLSVLRPVLRNVAPSLLGQQRPLQALQRLNETLAKKKKAASGEVTSPTSDELDAPLTDAAWAKVLGPVPSLWYVRRRNLPFASDLASKALPATTPPAILIQPQDIAVNNGANASFSVTAIGSGPLTYQWRKDGVNLADGTDLAGSTSPRLSLTNVQIAATGNYDVVVSNTVGSVTSDKAALTDLQKPVVSPPQSVTVNAGADVQFAVVVTGTPPLTFQWRKGGVNLVDGSTIVGAKTAQLTLKGVPPTAADSYDVVVTNVVDSVPSAPAMLTVREKPSVSSPQSLTANAGTDVQFSVSATGTPPLAFQWRKNGVALTDSTTIAGSTTAQLALKNVQLVDAGNYDVVVSNEADSVPSAPAALTVQEQPAVTPPMSVAANIGADVQFSVTATGTPPPAVQWRKNGANLADGANITGSTTSQLRLKNIQLTDAGNYDVVATNAVGSVTSAPAGLTVLERPAVTPPQSVTAQAGADVQFAVTATGTPPLAFQWRKNGAVLADSATIAGSTTAQLALKNVQLADAGNYDVVVSNAADSVPSAAAALTVQQQPAVTPPQSVTTNIGTDVQFSVTATGTPPPAFQWRKDGVNLADGPTISGATTAQLTLKNVQLADAGNYDVVVSNVVGSVTSVPAGLTVLERPAVTPPQSVTAHSGTDVQFAVTATGTPPLAFQWRKNGVNLTDGANIIGATTAQLTLKNIQAADAANYDVVVGNAVGSVSSAAATLTVQERPTVTPPQAITTNVGGDVQFNVTATGTPPPTFRWRKDGVNLADGPNISGATTAQLTLKNVQLGDAGNYDVVATNPVDSVASAPAALTIQERPTVTQPQSVTANAGTDVQFTVIGTGTPPPVFQWRKNGANLADGPTIVGATSAQLTLKNIQAADAGKYDVVVSNAADSVPSQPAELTVQIKPTVTQPSDIAAAVGTDVQFAVAATGTPPLAFQWRKDGANIPGANSAQLTLKNVQPANAGKYDVVVSNVVDSVTSEPAVLTVVLEPPTVTPPQSITTGVGTDVQFTVTATGTAPLEFQWRKNGVAIAGETSVTLVLKNVQPADAGSYDVEVRNAAGSVTSTAATLTIEREPFIEIRRHPRDVEAPIESPATFDVQVEGTLPLTFQWLKSRTQGGAAAPIPNENKRALRFQHVTRSDAGFYRVQVRNGAGMEVISNPARLTVTQL